MTVSDSTIQAELSTYFFKNLGKKGLNVSKNIAKNVLRNPSWALDITANPAASAASKNTKNVISAFLEVINFYHTGKVLNLAKLYILCYINGAKN